MFDHSHFYNCLEAKLVYKTSPKTFQKLSGERGSRLQKNQSTSNRRTRQKPVTFRDYLNFFTTVCVPLGGITPNHQSIMQIVCVELHILMFPQLTYLHIKT